jgi:hypothetical protein
MNHGLHWLATSLGAIVVLGTSACSSTRVDAEGRAGSRDPLAGNIEQARR